MSEQTPIVGYTITQSKLLEVQAAVAWLLGHWSATRKDEADLPPEVVHRLDMLKSWIEWTTDSKAYLGDWPPLPREAT